MYEDSIHWLTKAGIVLRCDKVNEVRNPVEFFKDNLSFKIYMSDVGLLSAKMMLSPSTVLSDINFSGEAKGAIAENYVAMQLVANDVYLYYWASESRAKVDFIWQADGIVVPVECKPNDNVKSRSLNVCREKYKPEYAIRISGKNFGFENGIKSVPLYAVFCIR